MRHSAVHSALAVCGRRLTTRGASVASQKLPNEDPGLRPTRSHGPDSESVGLGVAGKRQGN
jgi:hypothetical protein